MHKLLLRNLPAQSGGELDSLTLTATIISYHHDIIIVVYYMYAK